MPLNDLRIKGTSVTDLAPLRDLPLTYLACDSPAPLNAKVLRAIKTLETINGKPAEEFWKDFDGK
jgi:hypothetical protein